MNVPSDGGAFITTEISVFALLVVSAALVAVNVKVYVAPGVNELGASKTVSGAPVLRPPA